MLGIDKKTLVRLLFIAITVIVLVAVLIAALLLLGRGPGTLKFSRIELGAHEVSVNENVALYITVQNSSDRDYQSVRIRLFTESPYIEFYHLGVNGGAQLTYDVGLLASEEKTTEYVFRVIGKNLPGGTPSVRVVITAQLIGDNEITHEWTDEITVNARS